VEVQELRWESSGTKLAGENIFFYGKGNGSYDLGTGFLCIRELSEVKRVEFVSGRLSYMILRGHWCHTIVLNVHAPTGDKSYDVKDMSYEELECLFITFPK
jgi:hypothetical protein